MSALLIILLLGFWGALLFSLGYFSAFLLKSKWLRAIAGVIMVLLLFTLPIRDEIEGQKEFEALCQVGGIYEIDPDAVGKKFDLKSNYSESRRLPGYKRPVDESTVTYTDVATGKVVASAKIYIAKGGWLVRNRWLTNSGGGDGAFLGRSQCFPGDITEQARRLRAITNKIVN